jgi:hypothetical protein
MAGSIAARVAFSGARQLLSGRPPNLGELVLAPTNALRVAEQLSHTLHWRLSSMLQLAVAGWPAPLKLCPLLSSGSADAVDHRYQAVRALCRQVPAQTELIEQCKAVSFGDFCSWATGVKSQQNGNQTLDNHGVAFAPVGDFYSPVSLLRFWHQPDLRHAAVDPVGFGSLVFCQFGQRPAKIENVAVARLPPVQTTEGVDNFFEGIRLGHNPAFTPITAGAPLIAI